MFAPVSQYNYIQLHTSHFFFLIITRSFFLTVVFLLPRILLLRRRLTPLRYSLLFFLFLLSSLPRGQDVPVHDGHSVGELSGPHSFIPYSPRASGASAIRPPSPTWSILCGIFLVIVADMITSQSPPTPSLQSGAHHSSPLNAPGRRRSSHHDNSTNSVIYPSSQSPVKRFPPPNIAPPRASPFSSDTQAQRSGAEEFTSAPPGRQTRVVGNGPIGGSASLNSAQEQGASNLASQMPSAAARSKRNTPDSSTILSSAASAPEPSTQATDTVEATASKRRRPAPPAVKELPANYENASTDDLVALISSMLVELIRLNDKIPLREGRLTRFHSRSPPRISVNDYLQRLATHATLSPPILLSMVFYIDRLCALYPAFTVSSLTVHRFLISSATVASKGLSDSFWTNKTYARVGGISMPELALLELEFLWRVEWRIVPQPEALCDYYRSLVERCDDYMIREEIQEVKDASDHDTEEGKEMVKAKHPVPPEPGPPEPNKVTTSTS